MKNKKPQSEAKSEAALLACPFCGGQHIPEHPKMKEQWPCTSQPKLEALTDGGWRVTCYGCGVGTWDNLKYTKEQAVAAWNTRRQANADFRRGDLNAPNNPQSDSPSPARTG